MSWFDACAYRPSDRANGIRFPPRTATRRMTASTERRLLTGSLPTPAPSRLRRMGDRYASFANSGPGRTMIKRLGLPDPPRLRRWTPGDPLTEGPVLVGAAPGGRLADEVRKVLSGAGVETLDEARAEGGLGGLVF